MKAKGQVSYGEVRSSKGDDRQGLFSLKEALLPGGASTARNHWMHDAFTRRASSRHVFAASRRLAPVPCALPSRSMVAASAQMQEHSVPYPTCRPSLSSHPHPHTFCLCASLMPPSLPHGHARLDSPTLPWSRHRRTCRRRSMRHVSGGYALPALLHAHSRSLSACDESKSRCVAHAGRLLACGGVTRGPTAAESATAFQPAPDWPRIVQWSS